MLTALRNDDVPKHVAIRQAIQEEIDDGRYGIGERIPSESALAKQAGVARMTVRQAVSSLVDDGILERRQGSGTFVCEREMRRNLALLFFSPEAVRPDTLAWQELNSVRKAAAKGGREFRAMLMVPPYQEPAKLASELRGMGVGAVGLIDFGMDDREYILALKRDIPCVLFNKELPGVALPCAKPNVHQAARSIVDYFVERGRSRIGVMVDEIGHPLRLELTLALEGELQARGLPVDKAGWFEGSNASWQPNVDAWLAKMLAGAHRPDGLVVLNPQWPYEIRAGLIERGESLGRDMDLVVYGPPRTSHWASLSLNHVPVVRNALDLMVGIADGTVPRGGAPVRLSEVVVVPPAASDGTQQPGDKEG